MTCGLLKPVTSNALGLADAQSKISAVNQTTARYLKTELMCRVATEDCLKPLLSQKDNFINSFASLGLIETIPSLVLDHGRKSSTCHAFQAHVGPMRPTSRGSVKLKSNNRKISKVYKWKPSKSIDEIIKDIFIWLEKNKMILKYFK